MTSELVRNPFTGAMMTPIDLVNHPVTVFLADLLGWHKGITLMCLAAVGLLLAFLIVNLILLLEVVLRYQTFQGKKFGYIVVWLPLFIARVVIVPLAVIFGLWAAYQNATMIRNWWHRGSRVENRNR